MTNSAILAAKAQSLLGSKRHGVLATISTNIPGYPFVSVTPYSLDGRGQPVFLISNLAVHTRNLKTNPRASLFVTESVPDGETLASARVNVIGDVELVPGPERGAIRDVYLADHPESLQWIDFDDFAFYRLTPRQTYYVGGFGEMGWIPAADF